MDTTVPTTIFTRDNITLALAIIGAAGTILGGFYHLITTHVNLTFRIAGHILDKDGLFVFFQITNNSHLAITVNSIAVSTDGQKFYCSPIPEAMYTIQTGSEKEKVLLSAFPLSLAPLCGVSGYTFFPFEPGTRLSDSKTADFVIHTNRKKAIEMQLLLEKDISSLLL